MAHYYTNNIDLISNEQNIEFYYKDQVVLLVSDNGVFSKERVDYGSRVLLDSVEIAKDNIKILDVGCGYGPIGISLKKVYPNTVVEMVDVNERAIALANKGIKLNGLSNIQAYKSDGYDGVNGKYDLILTNPPIRAGKEVVHRILKQSFDYLNDFGEIYVVIQKKQGAPSAKKLLEEVFGQCEIINRDKGYYILKSVRK